MGTSSKVCKAVSFPLMPKGVEHRTGALGWERWPKVSFPLMPKGVEHALSRIPAVVFGQVSFPLMPKGVEHLTIVESA